MREIKAYYSHFLIPIINIVIDEKVKSLEMYIFASILTNRELGNIVLFLPNFRVNLRCIFQKWNPPQRKWNPLYSHMYFLREASSHFLDTGWVKLHRGSSHFSDTGWVRLYLLKVELPRRRDGIHYVHACTFHAKRRSIRIFCAYSCSVSHEFAIFHAKRRLFYTLLCFGPKHL